MTAPGRTRSTFATLTVSSVEQLTDDSVAVTFDVPADLRGDYDFAAGQSLVIRRTVDGVEQRRNYSICAPAGSAPRVGVREVPDGVFSTWLVHELAPGDQVEVGTPTGVFVPDLATPGHHVLVAAGSGITPVLSIAATVLRDPASTVTLIYGNRRTDTVMFADELADLKDRYRERLELVHVLSREPREAELFSGRIDAERLSALLRLLPPVEQVDHWWLCGPYGMVTDAMEVLRSRDVPTDRVHTELFYVEDAPPEQARHADPTVDGASSEVTVVLDGRSTTVSVGRDEAILDGAQRSRPDLPFACKGGVCGTCRARVVHGEVDMRRNFALEDAEVQAGFVLTCQSRPTSDEVTVDYDS